MERVRRTLEVVTHNDASPFVRALLSKAWRNNITCNVVREFTGTSDPVVIDRDNYSKNPFLSFDQDIDHCVWSGASCSSKATYDLLPLLGVGDRVCMIGDGHSVSGLEERLRYRGVKVAICDTRTSFLDSVLDHVAPKVIICSAPQLSQSLSLRKETVVDLSGAMKEFSRGDYVGPKAIGGLCTDYIIQGVNNFYNSRI
nr:MAG TPA: XdhC [Caudoviricetes sp.]